MKKNPQSAQHLRRKTLFYFILFIFYYSIILFYLFILYIFFILMLTKMPQLSNCILI